MSASKITVGAFTLDPASGVVEGPAAYLNSPAYEVCVASILAGRNAIINYGGASYTNLLVAIQTDYAGWRGLQQIRASARGGALESRHSDGRACLSG